MSPKRKLLYTALPIISGLALGIGILVINPNAGQHLGDFIYAKGVSSESYAYAVNKASPSVVNIYVSELNSSYTTPNNSKIISSASGVIISTSGYIVTNYHVVPSGNEPNHAIWAQTRDGTLYQAFVVGCDRRTDLALLKVEGKDLTSIELENNDPQVGDVVLAIGNPNNLGLTVTHGIISATARTGSGLLTRELMNIREGLQDLIQTDAPINQGNSGGALVNTNGDLVGINTASFNQNLYGTYGISFAIPTKLVVRVMKEIIKHGRVIRGYLGISDENENMVADNSIQGVLVRYIDPLGPAAQANIQVGDIVKKVNDKPINNVRELIDIISNTTPGTVLNLTLDRSGQTILSPVVLAEDRPNVD